jgi:hypothetical protein
MVVGDDARQAAAPGGIALRVSQQARADAHRIAALAQIDEQLARHGLGLRAARTGAAGRQVRSRGLGLDRDLGRTRGFHGRQAWSRAGVDADRLLEARIAGRQRRTPGKHLQ